MSFGLALAGGGIRGAAHVGVLLALEENGLKPDAVAGTSAGGIIAGLYASGISAQELSKIVREMAVKGASFADPDVRGILSLIPKLLFRKESACSGLLKGDLMEKYLRELTGGRVLREISMRTVIPAVDLCTGLTVAFTNSLFGLRPIHGVKWVTGARLSEVMRATSALPAVFRPKMLDGMCLVDGGVADVLPVDLLIAAGEPNVLAVDVSEYYKMPERINLLEVASHSLAIMETKLRQCMTRGEKLLLNPGLPDTEGVLNLPQMTECMEAGYFSAKKAMPRIKRIFGS
ncbi:MAG: patatin-like phospholipase family protein [Oscillospiraceae bacterium]|jgi:NTE family protein|nr:patatin-like phospholipase family protein [Oscillospiraceae bacterium]MCI1991343.1 patatin-like phospholipase family protein [Oscillospiraceae bacterium]MCI2036296.1 patatin-like phospholipase family protein [Oscillospiraceae bacterium]